MSWNKIDCLDCGKPAGGLEALGRDFDPVGKVHLCPECRQLRWESEVPLDDPNPRRLDAAECVVLLTWKTRPEDLEHKHIGDRTEDFIRRSFEKVRQGLEELRQTGILSHYKVNLGEARRVCDG